MIRHDRRHFQRLVHVRIDCLIQRVLLLRLHLRAVIHSDRAHIITSLLLKSIHAALELMMIVDRDLDSGLIIANHCLPGGLLALPVTAPLVTQLAKNHRCEGLP